MAPPFPLLLRDLKVHSLALVLVFELVLRSILLGFSFEQLSAFQQNDSLGSAEKNQRARIKNGIQRIAAIPPKLGNTVVSVNQKFQPGGPSFCHPMECEYLRFHTDIIAWLPEKDS
jgi:hypothetical protein